MINVADSFTLHFTFVSGAITVYCIIFPHKALSYIIIITYVKMLRSICGLIIDLIGMKICCVRAISREGKKEWILWLHDLFSLLAPYQANLSIFKWLYISWVSSHKTQYLLCAPYRRKPIDFGDLFPSTAKLWLLLSRPCWKPVL